ncbi:hypothetical protein HNY73_002061 [Argiope bruennichi]|uniref:Uncharacterized protein n=1 Tax=Argiope bruennichi TaxID=94029 RepID=A0A8T0FV13_ARGBR|nr:hypothetical protein HNY73_002061 [Argiope bruennichi]
MTSIGKCHLRNSSVKVAQPARTAPIQTTSGLVQKMIIQCAGRCSGRITLLEVHVVMSTSAIKCSESNRMNGTNHAHLTIWP